MKRVSALFLCCLLFALFVLFACNPNTVVVENSLPPASESLETGGSSPIATNLPEQLVSAEVAVAVSTLSITRITTPETASPSPTAQSIPDESAIAATISITQASMEMTNTPDHLSQQGVVLTAYPSSSGNHAALDLDDGNSGNKGDIQFRTLEQIEGSPFYVLEPGYGTTINSVGPIAPSFDECLRETDGVTPRYFWDLRGGDYFCVRTDEGHLAVVKIDSYGMQLDRIQVSFTTWNDTLEQTNYLTDESLYINTHIIYVDENATGHNNGTSWSDAFTDLQKALQHAIAGRHEIWVAGGIYKPTSTANRTASFHLKNGVAIYGGFNGEETMREQRDWITNATILSGDIGVVGSQQDNSYHVITGINLDATTVLDGFVITDGNATGEHWPYTVGGGLYNAWNSSPIIRNSIFANNIANAGGGIFNDSNSSPQLAQVIFQDNTAERGGGIANQGGHPVLEYVTFMNNTASDKGGGVYNLSSKAIFIHVVFTNNTADLQGGGMFNASSNPVLTNVVFEENNSFAGGGIYNDNSDPVLTDVLFENNNP